MSEPKDELASQGPVIGSNVDLLATESAVDRAISAFPTIGRVLFWPDFNTVFDRFEQPANASQKAGRRAGLATIILGTLALLASALAPIIGQGPDVFGLGRVTLIGIFAAGSGLMGVLVGSRALFGRAKLKWLSNRMMTERMRQFYFQVFPRRLPELVAALQSEEGAETFHEARRKWLGAFRLRFEGHEQAELTAAVSEDISDEGWLHPLPATTPKSLNKAALDEVFAYYRHARIQHQINYTNYKLAPSSGGLSEIEKTKLFSQFSLISISIIFGMYALWLGFTFFLFQGDEQSAMQAQFNTIANAVTLTLAILILAAHALEEGLQPGLEVERYRTYRASLRAAAARFDAAKSVKDKIAAMEQVEKLSFDEMCTFLTSQHEARFRM